MATEVEILLKAIDQASAALNQVRGSSEKLGKTTSGLEKNWNSLKANVPGLSNVLALATNPITLVTAGLGAMTAVIKSGVTETLAYNKTIREMSQVTGLMPDELSRVVQAADDWGISIDSVRTALQMANKNGVTPSIDLLADMADKYVNTADKTEFAAEAQKVFGKQYATLIPLLSQGGQKLREATAAVADNLVVTQKEIDASREYEVAVDNLGDAWTGVKQEIGNAVIPTLTKLLTTINENTSASQRTMDIADKLEQSFKAGLLTEEKYAKTRRGLMTGTISLADAMLVLDDANKETFDSATMLWPEEERLVDIFESLPKPISETEQALLSEAEATAKAEEETRLANEAMSSLYNTINGDLGPELEEFTESQAELEAEMKLVQDQIKRLNGEEHLTPDQQAELDALQSEYSDLNDQYTANADAHAEATKRILFDIVTQAAAVDGLTITEVKMLTGVALNWGLVDQATVDATDKAMAAFAYYNETGDIPGAMAMIYGVGEAYGVVTTKAGEADDKVKTLYQHAQDAEGTYDLVFNVSVEGDPIPRMPGPGEKPIGFQHGVDMIVPPGFEDDSFPFRASSGERVVVIPKSTQSSITNYFNMNVKTNSPTSTLFRDYGMMKASVG